LRNAVAAGPVSVGQGPASFDHLSVDPAADVSGGAGTSVRGVPVQADPDRASASAGNEHSATLRMRRGM
jgi:hypothetical protein